MAYEDRDYGFLEKWDLPDGNYEGKELKCSGVNWVVTGDFKDIAKNHCGAVAVTNLALYFAAKGAAGLKRKNERETFSAVHNVVGNGPVLRITRKARQYFDFRGYELFKKTVRSFSGIKDAIDNDMPCLVLLAHGITHWHWVLAVGYREYPDNKGRYLHIIDGWTRNQDKFYKPGSGSRMATAKKYWVE